MDDNSLKSSTITGLIWKLLERFGVSGAQFVLQIILARLLSPDDYGMLSIMIIFTTLANVFIQNGFNTALIQRKDATSEDCSSVFWLSFLISIFIYVFLYFFAPVIAEFYNMPDLIKPFRVISLLIIPGSLNSVQISIVCKQLDFKKIFTSNLFSIIISGILGVIMAYFGAGVWALVAQTLSNVIIACIVMWFTVDWRPKLIFNIKRVVILFSFGWKLLVSSLLDTLYQDLSSLVIGKKYNSETLGFFNRGKQFPQFIINAINGAVQSVMLPAMASIQDDLVKVKNMMRRSMKVSSYIVFPIMIGLAVTAEPIVKILLTDKWLPCVPYLQIFCISYAFYPVHTCNLQTINAIGRSDIFLKLEIIKKTIGIIVLCIAVFCFDSPLAIAATGILTTFTSCFINAYPNKELINYSYWEQMSDIIPNLLITCIMAAIVLPISALDLSAIFVLLIQVFVGVAVYLILSLMFRNENFLYILNTIMDAFKKRS